MASRPSDHPLSSLLLRALLLGTLLLSGPLPAGHAVVTTSITPTTGPGNLGTVVTPAGSVYTITGGTRPGGGLNLFHSFGLFSVGAGNTANFFNDTGLSTTNILSRVTGGNPSFIFGTIQTTGFPGAHLYLLNPAGTIFGPGAQLNVEGSFHVSTADYLKFANTNSDKFFVDPANTNSVLSVAPVAAFGFLSPNTFGSLTPGSITFEGSNLAVPTGQTLSVVGGDITITGGTLRAPSGRINLASVASSGEVVLGASGPDVASFDGLGTVSLSSGSGMTTDGDGGGTVVIRAGRLLMDRSFISSETQGNADGAGVGLDIQVRNDVSLTRQSGLAVDTSGGGDAGDIHITANTVAMDFSFLSSTALASASGKAGDINITADNLRLTSGAVISNRTDGAGQGGNLSVEATDSVTISGHGPGGTPSAILSTTTGAGNAGDVSIVASSVDMAGGAITTATAASGAAGNIALSVDRLSVRDGAEIDSNTFAGGQAGAISIQATSSISLSGQDSNGSISLIASAAGTSATGSAGTVSISTESLTNDMGLITSSTGSAGNAGLVTVSVGRLSLVNGGQITSATFAGGQGGNVTVSATGAISISGRDASGFPSGIFASTAGNGNAGQVFVSAPTIALNGGGKISSSAIGGAGQGGTVTVKGDTITISDPGSGLFTQGNIGNGGNLLVTAGRVELNNGATISAKSTGTGDAGSITITADDSFIARNSSVTTEALHANGGDITLHVAGRQVLLINSEITTHAAGNGGNILIDPDFIIADASKIIASAGIDGGNITLVASQGIFISPDSIIDASGTLGVSGTINISSPTTNLSGTLAPLSQEFMQASALLSARCAARLSGKSSSFVLAGRDGLPPAPGEFLPSPLFWTGSTATLSAGTDGKWGQTRFTSVQRLRETMSQISKSSLTPFPSWPSLQSRRLVLNQATPVGEGGCAL